MKPVAGQPLNFVNMMFFNCCTVVIIRQFERLY